MSKFEQICSRVKINFQSDKLVFIFKIKSVKAWHFKILEASQNGHSLKIKVETKTD